MLCKLTGNNKTRGRTTRGRGSGRRGNRNVRGRGGDNPPPQRCDINTISCPIPRTSPTYTTRFIQEAQVLGSNLAPGAPTYYFSLSVLADASTYEAAFDQWKYEAIRFTIRPWQNAIGLTDLTANSMVELYCVIDYDDATALTSAGQAQSKENCCVLQPGDSLQRTFSPHLASSVYQTGGFGGYSNNPPEWIDTASPAVQHYGVKLWIPTAHAAQVLLQSWNVTIEHYISFRQHL